MSRFKLPDRSGEASDPESERQALQRQRLEGAAELAVLKHALAERVSNVQLRERELEQALERVKKREAELEGTGARGARVEAARARLAELKAARAERGGEKERAELEARRAELDARATELETREAALERGEPEAQLPPLAEPASVEPTGEAEQQLAARERMLDARTKELDARSGELDARAAELDEQAAALAAASALEAEPVADDEDESDPKADEEELTRLHAKLEELREAERAFARTHAELAARSDALAEREAELAARERAASERETPAPGIDELEARIRRLEQGSRRRGASAQTFSGGLRSLEQRGLTPDEPLH